jgi:hypothetical protein
MKEMFPDTQLSSQYTDTCGSCNGFKISIQSIHNIVQLKRLHKGTATKELQDEKVLNECLQQHLTEVFNQTFFHFWRT